MEFVHVLLVHRFKAFVLTQTLFNPLHLVAAHAIVDACTPWQAAAHA